MRIVGIGSGVQTLQTIYFLIDLSFNNQHKCFGNFPVYRAGVIRRDDDNSRCPVHYVVRPVRHPTRLDNPIFFKNLLIDIASEGFNRVPRKNFQI